MTQSIQSSWQARYSVAQRAAPVPATTSMTLSRSACVVRDMYVDMSEVDARLRAAEATPRSLVIYADVVAFPAGYSRTLERAGLVIVARRVEVADGAQVLLRYTHDQGASLTLYAHELAGPLTVTAALPAPQPPVEFVVDTLNSLGVEVAWGSQGPETSALALLPPQMFEEGAELPRALVAIFQFATLLIDSAPASARSMLGWVARCSAQVAALHFLHLQTLALIAMLDSASTGLTVVPRLSRELYKQLATVYVGVAKTYESQHQRFTDQGADLSERRRAAQLMLDNHSAATATLDALVARATVDRDQAKVAVDRAVDTLRAQMIVIEQADTTFRSGIEEWKYQQQLEAAVKIITGVLGFAVAVGTTLATAGAAAPAAGGGAASGAAGTAKAAADNLKAVAEAGAEAAKQDGSSIADMVKAMERILKIIDALQRINAQIDQMLQVAKGLKSSAGKVNLLDTLGNADQASLGLEDASGTVYWERFKLEAQRALEPAIKNGIRGARDYQLQLDTLVVYGQAVTAGQVTAVQAGQELVRLLLEQQGSARQRQNLTEYLKGISAQEEFNTTVLQQLYQHYLEAKVTLYVATKSYVAAHRYWALQDSIITPAIAKSAAELDEGLANIMADYYSALSTFTPQDFAGVTVEIDDAAFLAGLRANGVATLPIQPDAPAFAGMDRVRLTGVRVWLEGARPQPGTRVYALVATSGRYFDRHRGQSFQFGSVEPWELAFSYLADEQGPRTVLIDGRVNEDDRRSFFEPTPFTEWRVSLPPRQNPGLDLSGLRRVVLEFSGKCDAQAPPQTFEGIGVRLPEKPVV